MYRIVGADGREYGPVSAEQLRRWIAEGRANGQTHVLAEGATEWQPLGTLPEFSLYFSRVSPAVARPFRATHPLATTGMVCGILALTVGMCCCYGAPFNVLGLIFSLIALHQIRTQPDAYDGKGTALAGVILSGLSLLFSAAMFALFGGIAVFDEITRMHQL